jgi:glycosyltransferase involved in cell wall biosynthesis
MIAKLNIMVLCKQAPQGKNLLETPYGRFFFIPRFLAEQGHEVAIFLLGHKDESNCERQQYGIHWNTVNLVRQGPYRYLTTIKEYIQNQKVDWIICFSDIYYGVLGQKLGDKYGIRTVIDAYDNYESYMPWLKPLHWYWRRALSKADIVTAAGPTLLNSMCQNRSGKTAAVIPMAADPQFIPLDKRDSRKELNLSPHKKLVGYCGSISDSRGIQSLFQAFAKVQKQDNSFELVLTGRKSSGISIPDGVQWLGFLADGLIPLFLNSMDVLTVINKASLFGNHSYPVKLYEAMSCRIPVAVSRTSSTEWILKEYPEFLCEPDNPENLCRTIIEAGRAGRFDYGQQPSWSENAQKFEELLLTHC